MSSLCICETPSLALIFIVKHTIIAGLDWSIIIPPIFINEIFSIMDYLSSHFSLSKMTSTRLEKEVNDLKQTWLNKEFLSESCCCWRPLKFSGSNVHFSQGAPMWFGPNAIADQPWPISQFPILHLLHLDFYCLCSTFQLKSIKAGIGGHITNIHCPRWRVHVFNSFLFK